MKKFLVELKTLEEKKKMRVQYKGNKYILLVYIDGQIYAIHDKCPHMGASLYLGKIEGENVYCKEHNLGISLKTGKVVDVAQADFLNLESYSRYVDTYDIEIEDGSVYLVKND